MNIDIPQPGPVRTGPTSQPGSMQAAGAPWAGAANVGGMIQDLGDRAMRFLVQQQRVKNVQMANELDISANNLFAEFENEMRRNPNPDSWLPDWQSRLEDFQKNAMPGNLAPEQKALLGERFADFQSRTTIRVAEMATIAGIDQARRSGMLAIEQDMTAGRYDSARARRRELGEAGLLDKPAEEELEWNITQHEISSEVEMQIEEDPVTTKGDLEARADDGSWLNYPDLPAAKRKQLIAQSEALTNERRRDENDMLEHALDTGMLQPEDIEGAEYLTDIDRERWKAALEESDPPSSEAHSGAWDILFSQRESFEDPTISDEEYAALWNDNRAKVGKLIPKQFQGDINQEMSYRSPANRKAKWEKTGDTGGVDAMSGWNATELKTEAYAKIQRMLKDGTLGNISEEASPREREAANLKAGRMRGKMRKFIADLESKGIDEASYTRVMEEVDRMLLGGASTQILDGTGYAPLIQEIPKPTRPDYLPDDQAGTSLLPQLDQ